MEHKVDNSSDRDPENETVLPLLSQVQLDDSVALQQVTQPARPGTPVHAFSNNIPILSPPALGRSFVRGNDALSRRTAADYAPPGGEHQSTPEATLHSQRRISASQMVAQTPDTPTRRPVIMTPAPGPVDSDASMWRRAARAALSGTSAQMHSTASVLRAGPRDIGRARGRRAGGRRGPSVLGRGNGIDLSVGSTGEVGGGGMSSHGAQAGASNEGLPEGGVGGTGVTAGAGEGGSGVGDQGQGSSTENGLPVGASVEIRHAIESSQNTLPLLMLLFANYIFTHVFGITAFVVGTSVLIGLDHRLRVVTDARDAKNGVALVFLAITAVLAVVSSAVFFDNFPEGEGLIGGLMLSKPNLGGARDSTSPATAAVKHITLTLVIQTVAIVDLWARFLSIGVKAVSAVFASSNDTITNNTNSCCCSCGGNATRRASTSCFCFRTPPGRRRRASDLGGSGGAGEDMCCFRPGGRLFSRRDSGVRGLTNGSQSQPLDASDSSDGRGTEQGGAGGSTARVCEHGPLGTVWRCVSAHLAGSIVGSCCYGWRRRTGGDDVSRRGSGRTRGSGGRAQSGVRNGDTDDEGEDDAGRGGGSGSGGGSGTGSLLGRGARQRRIFALVELAFMLYRTLLPVPVWLEYYSANGDHFAALYLVLKGMVVSYRADRLARAICYVRRGDLERGKFATPQEVAEAGSPDCCICYERMSRPVVLPCEHMFCGECVADWLERERTCPLCRSEVPTTSPIPRGLRNGQTSVVPQIL